MIIIFRFPNYVLKSLCLMPTYPCWLVKPPMVFFIFESCEIPILAGWNHNLLIVIQLYKLYSWNPNFCCFHPLLSAASIWPLPEVGTSRGRRADLHQRPRPRKRGHAAVCEVRLGLPWLGDDGLVMAGGCSWVHFVRYGNRGEYH